MTAGQKTFLKSLLLAALVETVILVFTFFPVMESFMDHSAAARAQRSELDQFLGLFGIVFHLPSIAVAFWCPPLIPLVQIFLLSGLFYWISGASGKSADEYEFRKHLEKD